MLVQRFRRSVPDYDAFFERTLLKHPRFSVAILRASGLAIDVGIVQQAVTYLSRFDRTQLCIVLSGRGYFSRRGGLLTLSAGDVMESDQLRQEPEGYLGSPCELLVLEWDAQSIFGSGLRGDARLSRIGVGDVSRLRSLITEVATSPPELWVVKLCRQLRALGLSFATTIRADIVSAPAPLARAYGALGEALSRLHVQPSLDEIAHQLALSQRQANRRLKDLELEYHHPFSGWRTFLHENRLEWATQLLSIPGIPQRRVASLAGYRSTIAMNHAFSARGAGAPGAIAKSLAERWR